MHIACVEDNPVNMALVQRVASMTKHTITSYSEGEVAQLELLNQNFDLILMDVELAGEISGLQVVKSLRTRGLRTPIIAMTAYAMAGDRDRCIEAGCDDYLAKPITIADLLRLLSFYSDMVDRGESTIKDAPIAKPVEAAKPVISTPPPAIKPAPQHLPGEAAKPTISTPEATSKKAVPEPVAEVPKPPGDKIEVAKDAAAAPTAADPPKTAVSSAAPVSKPETGSHAAEVPKPLSAASELTRKETAQNHRAE